jgi:hypothetical protein
MDVFNETRAIPTQLQSLSLMDVFNETRAIPTQLQGLSLMDVFNETRAIPTQLQGLSLTALFNETWAIPTQLQGLSLMDVFNETWTIPTKLQGLSLSRIVTYDNFACLWKKRCLVQLSGTYTANSASPTKREVLRYAVISPSPRQVHYHSTTQKGGRNQALTPRGDVRNGSRG